MADEIRGGVSEPGNTVIPPARVHQIVDGAPKNEGTVDVLMRLAARGRFFRSSDRRLFAQVPVGDRCEIYALKSTTFRDLLINCYFVDRHKLPTDAELRGVLGALEAFARFDGGTPPISSASATIKAQNRCIT